MRKKPICIVMADDDEDDRDAMREAMARNRLGEGFYTVKDGVELMDFLLRRGAHASAPRPGLILLDLNMPKKDGREVLRELKANESLRAIPVVVLTTSTYESDISSSYDLGACSFVSKPVTFEGLVRLVGDLGYYWFQVVQLVSAD